VDKYILSFFVKQAQRKVLKLLRNSVATSKREVKSKNKHYEEKLKTTAIFFPYVNIFKLFLTEMQKKKLVHINVIPCNVSVHVHSVMLKSD
jgi:hypothetical protein